MNLGRSTSQLSVLLLIGIAVVAGTYMTLGKTAGVFFGFMYIIGSPLLYELFNRTVGRSTYA